MSLTSTPCSCESCSQVLHTQIVSALRRTTFLLNSTRLIMIDPVARGIAGEAVDEARKALAAADALTAKAAA